ncbi:MAG: stage sporulation protein [Clostridia bacterium]|nr:stage sporulation protein [Clostridia bacterium]
MEALADIVRQVALIVLLAAFLEMLLPRRGLTNYVRLVLGLFVLVAILNPIVGMLGRGGEVAVAAWDLRPPPPLSEAVAKGRELARRNNEKALETYRHSLANQIKALVSLIPGAGEAEVEVEIEPGETGRLKLVRVILFRPAEVRGEIKIPPVELVPGDGENRKVEPELVERIKTTVCRFYNLSPDQVQVIARG